MDRVIKKSIAMKFQNSKDNEKIFKLPERTIKEITLQNRDKKRIKFVNRTLDRS